MSYFGGGNFTDQNIFPGFQIPSSPSPPSDSNSYSDSNSGHHHRSDFNKILLTAIASLSVVLLAVFALHLYARFYLRRRARRHAAIHRLTLAVAHYSSGDDNSGLDRSVIASLPTFVFKRQLNSQNDNDNSSSSVLECSVCLSNLEDEETARLLPNCKHVFHVGCIDTWLASRSTCPVCRTPVRPVFMPVEPQPREGPADAHVAPTSTTSSGEPPVADDNTTSDNGAKINGSNSNSRLNSFRRILTRERSISRIQPSSDSTHDDSNADRDLERQ